MARVVNRPATRIHGWVSTRSVLLPVQEGLASVVLTHSGAAVCCRGSAQSGGWQSHRGTHTAGHPHSALLLARGSVGG